MILPMTDLDSANESQSNTLCKACGLCCTGHLFIWTKLRAAELGSIEALGVKVFRSIPSQRGFNQPCPLWQGQCTIYETPHYPRFCHTYKCKLLKEVLEESASLPHALNLIEQAKEQIHDVQALLPPSQKASFRERLADSLESAAQIHPDLRRKANALLQLYENVFGVKDVLE
jgi:hypothetical protein